MSNIRLKYTYRNDYNYKNSNEVVLTNKVNWPIEDIESKLAREIDFDNFYPELIGLPSISPISNPFIDPSVTDADHPVHEDLCIEETDEDNTIDLDVAGMIVRVNEYDERELDLAEEAREYYFSNHRRVLKEIKRLQALIENK